MMKKLFAVLFSILCILPCMANIHIRSEAVETVIKQKITDTDAQIAALAEYIAQIKNAGTNAGIPASGVWSVCVAAGWDIKTQDGKSKCVDFGNALIKYANWNFRAVCGADKFMVERGTGYCIDNVFSNQVIGGTKVNRLTANGLVHEYARVKFDDNNLVCSKGLRKTTLPPDDYIQCISMDKNIAYEFAFDSVTATNDSIIASGLEEAVCKIFDSKYSPSGVTLDTAYSKGQTWPAACETTDSTICSKINETMSRFGRSAKIGTTGTNANKHTACIINENTITSVDKLRTAFGIDNQVFKNAGIQLNANVSLKEQVCDYVRKNVTNPEIINCTCNDAPTAVYDWSGIVTEKDDVLTCTINGKPVDFLFDDLSESNKRIASGGTQGMSCIVSGGTYSGERCIGLGEQQCNVLRQSNLTDCPECKAAKWDKNTESCILPSSASAQNLQKGINISLIVGGAVVGVALTVVAVGATTAVAGATAASVAATKTAVVLTAIETVGAGIELNAQLKINGIADDFLVKSNKCQSASCAKEMLSLNLQRMANFQNDMTAAEVDAVDRELAKLANLIPDDDELWATMLVNGTDMADNKLGFFDTDSWETEQVWRAVGIGLQLASVVAGISKWAISKSSRIAKSTSTIKSKLTRAVQSIDNTPESVLRDKRLELKKQIERAALKKRLEQGKIVHSTDNILLTPEMTKLAAPIDETLELHDMRLIDQEFSRIDANRTLSAAEKETAKKEVLRGLMYSDQGSTRFLESTMTYRQAMVESLAEDPQLFQYMDNFETLSDAQKQDFANKLVKKIESKLCDGTSCSNVYVGNFQMDADGNLRFSSDPTNVGIRGNTDGGNIYINATGKSPNPYAPEQGIVDNTKVEGFLSSLTHEHDHAIGNINPGTAGISQTATEFAEHFHVGGKTNLDNLLEQSAYTKEYSVSSGIVDEVKDLRRSSPQPAPIRHTTSTTANTSSALQSAKNKLYTYGTDFDKVIDDFLYNDGGYPSWWKMSDLTPAEHNALQSFLNEKGITLTTETQELNGVKETFYRLKK